MDRFAELKALVAVIETGSFAAAARELSQSRSTTNRLVISLEQRLKVQLLNRSTRQMSITSEGRAFCERARRILDDLAEAETCVTEASDAAVGQLRIGAPLTFGGLNISADVTEFMRRHPQLEVELNLETRMIDPVAEGYDVLVRVAEPDEGTTLVDHRIASFRYVACASPDYLARAGAPERPEDLGRHTLIQYRRVGETPQWTFAGPDGPISVSVRPALCSNNFDPVRDAAIAGLGVAVLPEFAIRDDLSADVLRRVLTGYALPERMLQVIYPPSRHLSAKVRLFTDFLEARYGASADGS
ncbi:MAG: LysR substrate-binding domain-containing protein [Pseudomonadota bacterium]